MDLSTSKASVGRSASFISGGNPNDANYFSGLLAELLVFDTALDADSC
jgi:hypothetical protein